MSQITTSESVLALLSPRHRDILTVLRTLQIDGLDRLKSSPDGPTPARLLCPAGVPTGFIHACLVPPDKTAGTARRDYRDTLQAAIDHVSLLGLVARGFSAYRDLRNFNGHTHTQADTIRLPLGRFRRPIDGCGGG